MNISFTSLCLIITLPTTTTTTTTTTTATIILIADLYTLAGITAIETLGGPQIGWRAGRVDAMDPSAVTPDGR